MVETSTTTVPLSTTVVETTTTTVPLSTTVVETTTTTDEDEKPARFENATGQAYYQTNYWPEGVELIDSEWHGECRWALNHFKRQLENNEDVEEARKVLYHCNYVEWGVTLGEQLESAEPVDCDVAGYMYNSAYWLIRSYPEYINDRLNYGALDLLMRGAESDGCDMDFYKVEE